MKKEQGAIHFGRMLWGFIFLLNPAPALFDILPDAIGYLLLVMSLRRVSLSLARFESAREKFIKLALLSLSKIPAFFLITYIAVSTSFSQGAIIPVATLAYAVGELCYLLPALNHLFLGFYHLGERWEVSSALAPFGKRANRKPEHLEKLAYAFFICRIALSTLPEILLAFIDDKTIPGSQTFLAGYIALATVGAVGVVLFGLFFLTRLMPYLRNLKEGCSQSASLIALLVPSDIRQARSRYRSLSLALVFLSMGVLFIPDITVDNQNLLWDVVGAACFYMALSFLNSIEKIGSIPRIFTVGWGISSVVTEILSYRYRQTYGSPEMVGYLQAAESAYYGVIVSTLVTYLFLLGTVVFMTRAAVGVNRAVVADPAHLAHNRVLAYEVKRLHTLWLVWGGFGGVLCILSALQPFATLEYVIEATATGQISVAKLAWFPQLVRILGFLWFFGTLYMASATKEEAKTDD